MTTSDWAANRPFPSSIQLGTAGEKRREEIKWRRKKKNSVRFLWGGEPSMHRLNPLYRENLGIPIAFSGSVRQTCKRCSCCCRSRGLLTPGRVIASKLNCIIYHYVHIRSYRQVNIIVRAHRYQLHIWNLLYLWDAQQTSREEQTESD